MSRSVLIRLTVAALLSAAGLAAATPTWVAATSHNVVRFKVEGPLDDVVGETHRVAGALMFSPEMWAKGTGIVAVQLSTLSTGIDQRDEDMRVEFLETKRFPTALLTIDQIKNPSAASLEVGRSVEGDMTGTFEVHGVRRAVVAHIRLRREEEGRVTCHGAFSVPLADYSIARPQRLFLKLGDTADVSFSVDFTLKPEAVAAATTAKPDEVSPLLAPTVSEVKPLAPAPKPRPPRRPKPQLQVTFLFSGSDPKATGERLFHSVDVGGAGNKLTCFHCHAKTDEREGIVLKDGFARAANTLYNAGQRPKFWNGFATTLGAASAICQKQYMKGEGLTADQQDHLTAFIQAISPDPVPELDYRLTYRSMDSALRDPTGGDVARGKKLADRYCMTCHLDGRVGPVWAPGLYEPDWVVRRVRRLDGHQNHQMPNFTIVRLPDSELRDIVTYLTSPKSAPPVFDRKTRGASARAGMP